MCFDENERGFSPMNDSVHCMDVQVQRDKSVKNHRISVVEQQQAVATAPVNADSLFVTDRT